MTIRSLDKIFKPRSIAVVGASRTESSLGRMALENLAGGGFLGPIYAVNPKYERIGDRECYAGVADLPQPPDLALVCTPAATVPRIVRECGEMGIHGLVIFSAGFRESGAEGAQLEDQLREAAAEFSDLRIIGPNCLGVMAPHAALNASFANGTPLPGRVTFISQSGALCTAVLDWALQEQIGFSHFVSVGNMVDVTIGDLIDYFGMDPWTESIIFYVESITEARQFMSAARAFARRKPIIAYKAGRFSQSAEAATSHTGAMAGVDTVYEAAFNRAGIVRIEEMTDMFDCAELLAGQQLPRGPRLAIVTNAGGPGVMATDTLLARQGELAKLGDETMEKLDQLLPAAWSHRNPVDVLGDAKADRLAGAVELVLADSKVDAVLVIFAPQAASQPTASAQAVIDVAKKSHKPLLTSWMGGGSVSAATKLFNRSEVPTYTTPEHAVRAFMYLVSYARMREVLYETPRDLSVAFPRDRLKLRPMFGKLVGEGQNTLSESASKSLLEAYKIPIAKPYDAHSEDDAVRLARAVGYPVVMKILSPGITHKTDVGGVMLGVANDNEVAKAFRRIVASAAEQRPDARIDGVTIQPMVSSPVGQELIVGAQRDPVFGAVMLVGAGGTAAELFQDRALELPPINERLVRRMLESLRSWPRLQGYRGRPPVDIDRLIEVLIRLSYLVADYPEIKELDVNPLLVTPDRVIALDARIVLDPPAVANPPRPFSHLAIRPYPEDLIKPTKLKDGTQISLRPIKPEDEPLWYDMVTSCSNESIRLRFRYLFKQPTHEMATRFCFIDYDREIAIVAETEERGQRKFLGVARLVADADHLNAEYAVLVADAYQGIGLGTLLTDYCLEICKTWGIHVVVVEVAPENHRMLSIFRRRGFALQFHNRDDVVIGRKTL